MREVITSHLVPVSMQFGLCSIKYLSDRIKNKINYIQNISLTI